MARLGYFKNIWPFDSKLGGEGQGVGREDTLLNEFGDAGMVATTKKVSCFRKSKELFLFLFVGRFQAFFHVTTSNALSAVSLSALSSSLRGILPIPVFFQEWNKSWDGLG